MTETYCVAADVQLKAGANATALTAGQYTSLINQAENFINATIRKDLLSTYAALSTNVKLLLNDACSSKAAILAIVYNQDGYYNSEVTNLLNVNATIFSQCIKLLQDQDIVAGIQDGF